MELKKLSNKDIENIYKKYMLEDFPIEELKPLDVLLKLNNKENYLCLGLYNNEELLGYAFLVWANSFALIDYYSVCKIHRNSGIGSKFLNILKDYCKNFKGIIVEVEKVEDALNNEEIDIRKRRINFYKRNGMIMTTISSKLFEVNYNIMCLCNINVEDSEIYEGLKDIYHEIFPDSLYSKYIELGYV